jgi:di/tricarboxylate transporter
MIRGTTIPHTLLSLGSTTAVMVQAPELTTGMLVVFGLVAVALVLFVSEVLPLDVSAIILLVLVVSLSRWTGIGPDEGLSGFASQATITVLAMFILSDGVRRTGLLSVIGDRIIRLSKGSARKQLAALVGLSGSTAGFINNTPVVAMMIPMAVDIANRTNTSPSKYLIPISFAAMMGGMLTLIGTSTNLLASDVSARLLDRPLTMFEFTHLGLLVLVSGSAYLLIFGWFLTPERISPRADPLETFQMNEYLTELRLEPDSPLEGKRVDHALREMGLAIEVVRMRRKGEIFEPPIGAKAFQAGDILLIRTDPITVKELMALRGLGLSAGKALSPEGSLRDEPPRVIELVVLSETPIEGETLQSLNFRQTYEASVLAIRRGKGILHERLKDVQLEGGDTLLVHAGEAAARRLAKDRNFILTQSDDRPEIRKDKVPVALAILAAVVVAAATGAVPIVVSALAGVVAMVVTGCLKPTEMYGAVDWNVIFLLAGVIPLGMALERTGGAEYLAHFLTAAATGWHPLLLLFLFYLLTAVITEVVSNNASVVLMIPVAVSAANLVGADPFSFLLAVTFAASTPMLSPVGYQTNLMVYGPGGYRFTDFFRVGAPLQLLLAVVTSLGIWMFWGV